MSDVPDLDAIEARAAAYSAYSHRDIPVLVAYARRLKGERDVLAACVVAEQAETCELRAEVARLERVIAAMEGVDAR